MSAPVVDSVLELIGRTPMVRLRNVIPEGSATVWVKAEHLNPGGSVKDRICLAMLERAEKDGLLEGDTPVVEPTSGNTGIGLAIVCAEKGRDLVLTMSASMSLERRQLLSAYGAEIVLTDPQGVMPAAIEAAARIVEERGAFNPNQFENAENPGVHRRSTAREILEAMGQDRVAAFVSAVGTGGTVSGVGRALKDRDADTLVIAVEPDTNAVISGDPPGPSKIQGIGAGFVPKNYDPSVVDELMRVTDEEAFAMKRRLAKDEGLLVGPSAGANVVAAARVAARLGEDAHVVTLLCDTGERYFSLDEFFPS